MAVLPELSGELATLVAAAGPQVVRVEGRRRFPASGIIWSEDGLVITAHHVLTRDEDIRVCLGEGQPMDAEMVGRDPTTDLALLRVSKKLTAASAWVELETVQVGHLVLALGRPGDTIQATLGIVSAMGDSWRTPSGGRIARYLQTDAVFNPGFSGGALVTAEGGIIGVNTSALLRGTTLTIPAPTVRQVVEELLAHGRISRGYLGVGIQLARLPEELAQTLGQHTGLLITSVESGSPAEEAKLVLGDTIVTISGETVRNWDDLRAVLSKDRIGIEVKIQIVRAGQLQESTATISEHP